MNANSKKVMEKSVEKSVSATKDESLGNTKEAPKSVAATKEESSGGTKEAPKSVAATKEESLGGTKEAPKSMAATREVSLGGAKEAPQSVAATKEESLGGAKEVSKPVAVTKEESVGGTKEAPKSVAATKEGSSGGTKEAPKSVPATKKKFLGGTKEAPKSVDAIKEGPSGGIKEAPKPITATIEESLRGTKKTPQKSTEKPLQTMVTITTPGNKALAEAKAKSDFDVESVAGTSAKLTKAVKPEAEAGDVVYGISLAKKELATTFDKKAAREGFTTGLKRIRDYFAETKEVQEKRPKKKSKVDAKEPVDPNEKFWRITREKVSNMTRRELEDLAIRKMVEEKKANSEVQFLRSQLIQSQNALAFYGDRIAEVNEQVQDLNNIANPSKLTTLTRPPWATGKRVAETVKGQSHAAGSMLPPSSGIPFKERPPFGPKPEKNVPKCSTRVRPAPPVYRSTVDGVCAAQKQRGKLALPKAVIDYTNKIASKAKPAKDPSTTVNDNQGQSENSAAKDTAQPQEERKSI